MEVKTDTGARTSVSFTKVFPGKIKPVHGFLYWWICEKNNSLKWIEVF